MYVRVLLMLWNNKEERFGEGVQALDSLSQWLGNVNIDGTLGQEYESIKSSFIAFPSCKN